MNVLTHCNFPAISRKVDAHSNLRFLPTKLRALVCQTKRAMRIAKEENKRHIKASISRLIPRLRSYAPRGNPRVVNSVIRDRAK